MPFRNNTRHSYGATFYCQVCFGDDPNIKYLPVSVWCKQNYYTRNQVYTLLRKHKVLGLRHKGKMYIATNPYYEGE